MNRFVVALIASFVALSVDGAFASEIVPRAPVAFEPVNLRMQVDSCVFVPGTVRVASIAGVIHVTQQRNNCLVPGTPMMVDVMLGVLPAGDYRVEVHATPSASDTPAEVLQLSVATRPEIAVFPPPVRPLTSYSGMWWDPQESGWGLSLHQSAFDSMIGSLLVYGASGAPEWFTLQGGRWSSFTTWTATVYRTTGPAFAVSSFDPRAVSAIPVGTATIDFAPLTAANGAAVLTYSVQGVTVVKPIVRLAF